MLQTVVGFKNKCTVYINARSFLRELYTYKGIQLQRMLFATQRTAAAAASYRWETGTVSWGWWGTLTGT